MTEKGSIVFGDTQIDYSILRSRRRKKTIEITLDHQEGVLVAVPHDTPSSKVAGVVHKRAGWIVRKATECTFNPTRKELVSGESLPYLGRRVTLFVGYSDVKRVRVAFDHWTFTVTIPSSLNGDNRRPAIAKALRRWYNHRATERLTILATRWATKLGCNPRGILIRNQRQRWGSCSPDGIIRFNWRVVQLEPALIDYVVVHELVHLLVRRHSYHFWDKVGSVLPDYRLRRKRLKDAGAQVIL